MKKENLRYYILPIVLILIYVGYSQFLAKTTDEVILYKSGYTSDCANDTSKPNSSVILTEAINIDKLEKNDIDLTKEFDTSKCVTMSSYSINKYHTLNDFKIEHVLGQNDTTYQVSYQTVLNSLKKKSKHSALDKKIIKSLEFYTKTKGYNNLIPGTNSEKSIFQANQPIIGPDEKADSGKYILTINIDVVKNDIYVKDNKQKKQLKDTQVIFNGLSMKYVKVGE